MNDDPFLLNVFNQAYLMYYLYDIIRYNKFKEIHEIEEFTNIDKKIIKEVLKGLHFFELIQKKNNFFLVKKELTDIIQEEEFKLLVLKNLRRKVGNPQNWKKNASLLLVIEYLIEKNIVFIKNNDRIFCRDLTEYCKKRGYKHNIDINTNKLYNWCNIFHYLGFLRKITSSEFIFHINKDLFLMLINLYIREFNSEIVFLRDFLEWLNENYLLIPLEGRKIPILISKIFYSLNSTNQIEFLKSGDRQLVEFSDIPTTLKLPQKINAIKIIGER
ncbi:MAG: hypothetical protein ACTSVV_08275 [Promethearchaeota archaeon]